MPELKQVLGQRHELSLAQTPQQILRSELTQMSILELELRVRAELDENPFLEEAEESVESEVATEADDSAEDRESLAIADTEAEPDAPPAEPEKAREIDWDEILNDSSHWEYRAQSRVQVPEEGTELPQPSVETLADHLLTQLHLDDLTDTEQAIGEEIIGSIDRDGHMHNITLEEIAADSGVSLETVARVHRRIMTYDPPGIGARTLRECLLVQLELRDPRHPVAEQMVAESWDDIINKRYEVIRDRLSVTLDVVRSGFEAISRLNPKPGEGYFDERQNYVIPDLVVTQVGGKFEVFLNDGDIPNFHINSTYKDLYLKQEQTDKKVREFLTRKLESARWFINAIHQRRTTMLRTMRAIVDRQIDFFRGGPQYLHPMILADIADEIGMDISTISRVTSGKYVQTDWGVFELKYFFSEAMETDEGDEVSNRVIKARLKELIEGENKMEPLSDQELTDMLNADGFQIRRRTVAKYREQLRIPIKRLRRMI
ncbi:MAG: RNA polymerase factor sigma-54 [Calditrichaeota bacterium]|nr:RNA polymerase factor sigma-54 [Calditrichota bacterium]